MMKCVTIDNTSQRFVLVLYIYIWTVPLLLPKSSLQSSPWFLRCFLGLWGKQVWGKDPFLFQNDNIPMHKGLLRTALWLCTQLDERTWLALTSTSFNTFGMKWNTDCQLDLITQHQCWTSLMFLWLNGNKSLQPGLKVRWKTSQRSWGC